MAEEDNKCGHNACSCAITSDQKYCGDHCENAAEQDIIEISCDCGHPGCA